MNDLDIWLNNTYFKKHLDNAQDKDRIISQLEKATELGKINWLLDAFPKTLDDEEIYSSLFLNISTDYSKIITKYPSEFRVAESKDRIHVGHTNQMGVYYDGRISEYIDYPDARVASFSFHFLDTKNGKELLLEGIQGDIYKDSGHLTFKEAKRMFGKLNTYYGVDWRQGILKQVYDYGKEQGMNVKGNIPGIFYLFGSSITEYPLYALNYLSTYLKIGIPFEDITFRRVIEDDIRTPMVNACKFLESKSYDDKASLIQKAASEYGAQFSSNRDAWLWKHKIELRDYEKNCVIAYKKIFSEVFS